MNLDREVTLKEKALVFPIFVLFWSLPGVGVYLMQTYPVLGWSLIGIWTAIMVARKRIWRPQARSNR
jgi:hypothetical protein